MQIFDFRKKKRFACQPIIVYFLFEMGRQKKKKDWKHIPSILSSGSTIHMLLCTSIYCIASAPPCCKTAELAYANLPKYFSSLLINHLGKKTLLNQEKKKYKLPHWNKQEDEILGSKEAFFENLVFFFLCPVILYRKVAQIRIRQVMSSAASKFFKRILLSEKRLLEKY